MDHFFQMEMPERGLDAQQPMMDGYTLLAYMAGHTGRARLGTMVTGGHYRHPGHLIKIVTNLDVISGGRAMLGIGAGWYERESRGLGFPFPPVAERFEYTGNVEADLLRVVRFYHTLVQTRGRVIAMMLNEVPRQPELLELTQSPLTIVGKIITMLERYQQEGALVAEPPTHAFITLVGPLFMSMILGSVQPSLSAVPFDPSQHVRRYLQGRTTG